MEPTGLPSALLERFRRASLARLETIEAGWNALIRTRGGAELETRVAEELHTLKGDARVAGRSDVNLLCHKLEELLGSARERRFHVGDDFDRVAAMTLRFLGVLLHQRGVTPAAGINVESFVAQIDDALGEDDEPRASSPGGPTSERTSAGPQSQRPERASPAIEGRIAVAATTVFLEHLSQEGRSRARLREVWLSLCSLIAPGRAVEIAPMLAKHEAAARDLAASLGKRVEISADAGDVRVNVSAALAIDAALLHVLRNAVDHGVEDESARRLAKKPDAGVVTITARSLAHAVEITIEDDGAGVDRDAVRRRAVELGLLTPTGAQAASDEALLAMLLRPGFSTSALVSDISGRGVGLAAAAAALARASGSIEITSTRGRWTRALIRVPQPDLRVSVWSFCPPRSPLRSEDTKGGELRLAIPSDWTAEIIPDPSRHDVIDPLRALEINLPIELDAPCGERGQGSESVESGTDASRAAHDVIVIGLRRNARDARTIAIYAASGSLRPSEVAERFCPTSDEHPAEVVLLGGAEALLIRPERLPLATTDPFRIG